MFELHDAEWLMKSLTLDECFNINLRKVKSFSALFLNLNQEMHMKAGFYDFVTNYFEANQDPKWKQHRRNVKSRKNPAHKRT